MRDDLAWRIAGFAQGLRLGDLTPARRGRIALCYLDFLALAAAGSRVPEAAPALLLAEPGDTRVPGLDRPVSTGSAMVALGYLGALLQLHDGFGRGGNHPSSALVPAVWALGQGRHGHDDLLAALAAGYEVANRLAAATHPDQSLRGSAPTATMGAIGAAVIAARLTGLDRTQTAEAISIAAFLAPVGTYEALRRHGSAVPFHGGLAARTGWEAARLAAAGLEGGASVLEGRPGADGLLAFLAGRAADLPDPAGWAGETLDLVFFKPTPGCRHVQPAWEALARILPETGGWEDVADVLVETYPLALAFGERPDARHLLYDRLMSLPWAMAAALVHGGLGLDTVMAAAPDPRIAALMPRIRLAVAPDIAADYPRSLGARVTVTRRDGTVLRGESALLYGETGDAQALSPPGGLFPPLDAAALIRRAGELLAPVWRGAERALVADTRRLTALPAA